MQQGFGVTEGILASQKTLSHAVGSLAGSLVSLSVFLDSFTCFENNVPPINFCRDNQ
jgi:hypothetical protein